MRTMQMIQEECANWRNGRCTGAVITKALQVPAASPRPRCLVADGRPCRYFETTVAPMAEASTDAKRRLALRDAVAEYHGIAARARRHETAARTPQDAAPAPRHAPKVGNPYQHSHRPTRAGDRA